MAMWPQGQLGQVQLGQGGSLLLGDGHPLGVVAGLVDQGVDHLLDRVRVPGGDDVGRADGPSQGGTVQGPAQGVGALGGGQQGLAGRS